MSTRSRWKVTIKVNMAMGRNSHRPVNLEVNEFGPYEIAAVYPGAAVQRAFAMLRKEPALFATGQRQCLVTVEHLEVIKNSQLIKEEEDEDWGTTTRTSDRTAGDAGAVAPAGDPGLPTD